MARSNFSRREVLQTTAALTAAAALPAKAAPGGEGLTFLAVGDWGKRGIPEQRAVAARMGERAQAIASQFVLTVGDNFYDDGVQSASDSHWKESYEDIYVAPSLQTPWYASLGNHDYDGKPQGQLDYARTSSRWRMPARYYQQRLTTPEGQAVDLFALDTTPLADKHDPRSQDQDVEAQKAWLEAGLAASNAPWKLVFGHHPVFSGGVHGDTPTLVAWLKPLLEKHGVQAYICGHDHDLQHLVAGPVSYIATGGGADRRPVRAIRQTVFSKSSLGFTAYRIAGGLLTVDFIDDRGQVVHTAQIPQVPALAAAAAAE